MLAAAALRGAHPAVLHPMRGVDLALLGAGAAGLHARPEHRAGHVVGIEVKSTRSKGKINKRIEIALIDLQPVPTSA